VQSRLEQAALAKINRLPPIRHCHDSRGLIASPRSSWAGTDVDFRTDQEFDETSDRYIAQVQAYSRAIAGATNAPARGVLLVV